MEQYISKSALIAEIEKRKHKLLDHIICERDKEWAVRTAHQLNRIISFLNTLEVKEVQEEPVSEDLEKAAVEAFKQIVDSDKNNFLEIFKTGANWKKKHLMAKAIEGNVLANGMGEPILHLWDKGKYLVNKKVKVVVIEED